MHIPTCYIINNPCFIWLSLFVQKLMWHFLNFQNWFKCQYFLFEIPTPSLVWMHWLKTMYSYGHVYETLQSDIHLWLLLIYKSSDRLLPLSLPSFIAVGAPRERLASCCGLLFTQVCQVDDGVVGLYWFPSFLPLSRPLGPSCSTYNNGPFFWWKK